MCRRNCRQEQAISRGERGGDTARGASPACRRQRTVAVASAIATATFSTCLTLSTFWPALSSARARQRPISRAEAPEKTMKPEPAEQAIRQAEAPRTRGRTAHARRRNARYVQFYRGLMVGIVASALLWALGRNNRCCTTALALATEAGRGYWQGALGRSENRGRPVTLCG